MAAVDAGDIRVDDSALLPSYAHWNAAMPQNPVTAMSGIAAECVRRVRMRWVGFTTFLLRTHRDIVGHFVLTLAPPAVMSALYLVVFGGFAAERIGDIDGVRYQQFLVPGLILLPVVTASYGQAGLSLVVAKLYRTLDEHLLSPQPPWMIVVSYTAGGMLRGIMTAVAAGLGAVLVTHLSVEHAWLTMGTVLLVALVASLAGFINGVFADTLAQVNGVSAFVLTPLTYLGGIFYSNSLLPAWAQKVSLADPIFYMANLLRYGLLGVSDVHSGIAVAALLLVAGMMLASAVCLVDRGVGIRE